MANQLDLRDLRYFEVIAETGHLGRAARKLHRTQPALTSCVRRLEETVGTPLFQRVGRGIRLTAAGHALMTRARLLRLASEDALREVGELGKGVAGMIRIGVVPTVATFLLPGATRDFLADAPGVTIKAMIGQSDVLMNALRSGDLDLVVSLATSKDQGEFTQHPLFEDDVVVVASRAHPIHRKRVRMKDLLDYPWVLAAPGVATRDWLDHAFVTQGLPPPTVQIETNILLMLPSLIETNSLLSFLSRRHVGRKSALREVPLKQTTMPRKFVLVYRREGYLSPAAVRFAELLQKKGKELFRNYNGS